MIEESSPEKHNRPNPIEHRSILVDLMDHLPGLIYRCQNDKDWTMDFISQGCLELTGYSVEELVHSAGQSFGQLIHPADRELVDASIHAALDARRSFQIEYRLYHRTQGLRWVWEQGRGVYAPDGALVCLEGYITDITEQRVGREQLQRSDTLFTYLTESVHDVIFRYELTPIPHLAYVSPSVETVTGYTLEEHYHTPNFLDVLVDPSDRERLDEYVAQNKDFDGPTPVRWRHRDGHTIWTEQSNSMERDGRGQAMAVFGVIRDISQRKLAELALQQRTREVELLYEAGRKLSSTLDLRAIYATAYGIAAQMMDCSGLLVSSYNPEDQLIHCVFGIHMDQELDVGNFPPIPLEHEGQGLQSEVIRSGEPINIPDYPSRLKSSQAVYHYDEEGLLDHDEEENVRDGDVFQSALMTPLKLEGRVVGVVQVFSNRMDAYREEDLRFLDALAGLTAAAAHNARLYQQAQQEVLERRRAEDAYKHAVIETQQLNRRLGTLYEIGLSLAQVMELRKVYAITFEHISRLADCPNFAISRYDRATRSLRMEYAIGDGVEIDVSQFPTLIISEADVKRGRTRSLLTGQVERMRDLVRQTLQAGETGRKTIVGGNSHIPDSAMYIPLISAGQIIGLMEMQSYQPGAYTQDQEALLGSVANQIALAIERAELYEQMRASLGEKEVLLREVHHRVKNNLEVVIALAELQSRGLSDPIAMGSLRDFQTRVRTIALVHENLYLSPSIASIRADVFLNRLMDNLVQAFGPPGLDLRVDSDDSVLSVSTATPCGLIVTELVTNAIKHAYPQSAFLSPAAHGGSFPGLAREAMNSVQVRFHQEGGQMILEVSDHGAGLPPELDWRATRSLGLRLVNRLAEQLNGVLQVESSAGTLFRLIFPAGEVDE